MTPGQPAANRRLARGIFAFLGSAAMRVAVQVATLPILFASWSPERVGGWLLLFALPAYFAVVGQAFSGAGGTIALAAAQEQKWEKARNAMRAAWLASTAITAVLLGAILLAAWVFREALVSTLSVAPQGELVPTVLWLALYVAAIAQSAAIGIAFRIAQRYPQFILSNATAMLLEVAVLAVCVVLTVSYTVLAAALALLRVTAALIQYLYSRRAARELYGYRPRYVRAEIRGLIKPTLAFVLLPIVYVLNLQAYTLLVGAVFGAAVLAGFVATRTIVRLIDLVTNVVFGIQFFEAGYLADNKLEIQQRQLATMTLATLALALCFGAFLLVAGPLVQEVFTIGKTSFDHDIALVLLASGTIRALAVTPQALVSAENRHASFVTAYLLGSLACLALATGLASTGASLVWVLAVLIPAELAQAIPAFRSALGLVGMSPRAFLRSLVSRQRFMDVADLWRFLTDRPKAN